MLLLERSTAVRLLDFLRAAASDEAPASASLLRARSRVVMPQRATASASATMSWQLRLLSSMASTLSEVQEGSDVKRDRRPSPPIPLDERSRCCRLCMFEQASSTMPHPEEDMLFPLRSKVSSDLLSHSDPAILTSSAVKGS